MVNSGSFLFPFLSWFPIIDLLSDFPKPNLAPAYLTLLPEGSSPTNDPGSFLDALARRMGMLKRGGEVDLTRAAVYFVKWWREEGGLLSATSGLQFQFRQGDSSVVDQEFFSSRTDLEVHDGVHGHGLVSPNITQAWGFDFQWEIGREDAFVEGSHNELLSGGGSMRAAGLSELVQGKMEKCLEDYIETSEREEAEEKNVSPTQVKKRMLIERKEIRMAKRAAKQRR